MVWEAGTRLHKLTVAPVALCFHLPHSHPHHLSPTTSTCHLYITCTCHLPSSPVSIVHTSHLYLSPTTCIPFPVSLSPTPVTLHHLPECYGRFNLLVYCMVISCHHLLCYQHHVTGLPRCQHILQRLSPQLCATSALPAWYTDRSHLTPLTPRWQGHWGVLTSTMLTYFHLYYNLVCKPVVHRIAIWV